SDDDNTKNTSNALSNGGIGAVRKQLNRRSLSADCLPKVTQDRTQTYQDTRGVVRADTGSAHTYAFRDRSEQQGLAMMGPTSRLHMELVSDPDEGHDEQDMDVGNCSMSSGEILAWIPEATDMPSNSLCGIASTFKSRLRAEEAEEKKQRDAYRTSVALLTAEMLYQTGATLSRSDSNSSNVSCSTAASSDASTVIHDQDVLDTDIQELRRNKSKRRDAVNCAEGQEPTNISSEASIQQEEHSQQLLACGDKTYLVSSDSSPTHFYDSPQVREALRLFLASNGCEFEEMIDNGFPSEVLLNRNDDEDDEDDEDDAEDDESAPDHCRYLTLRITLTPWHSRADEADLYGAEVEPEAPQEIRSMMSELFSRGQGDKGATSPLPSIDLASPSKVPTEAFTRSDSAFSSATTALDGRSSSSSVSTSRNSSRNSSLKRESKAGMKPHLASLPVNIVTREDARGQETSSPCPSSLSSSASSSSSSTPASSPCGSPTNSPSMGPHRKGSSSSAVFYFPAVNYIAEAETFGDQEPDLTPRPTNSLPRPLMPRMMSDQSNCKSEDATATRHLYTTRPPSTQARRSRRYPYHIHIQQQGSTEDDEDISSSLPVGRAPNSSGPRPRPLSRPSSNSTESEEIEIYECYHISNLDHLYKADGSEQRIDMPRSSTTSKPQPLHFDKPVVMSLSRHGTRLFQTQSRRGADAHLQTKNVIVASAPPPLSAKSLRRREVGRRQVIVPASDSRSQRAQSPMEDEFVSTADLSWEAYSIYSNGRGNQDLSPIIYGHEEIAAHTDGCWRPGLTF
ncbi:hypothetical protein BGZ70_003588, partial [Mortierella alpina]